MRVIRREIQAANEEYDELLTIDNKQKLRDFFLHLKIGLAKAILQGTVKWKQYMLTFEVSSKFHSAVFFCFLLIADT